MQISPWTYFYDYIISSNIDCILRCVRSRELSVYRLVNNTVSLDHYRVSVDHGTWYIFQKLWPTSCRLQFPKCIFPVYFCEVYPAYKCNASSKLCEIIHLLIPAVAEVSGGYKQVKVRGRLKIHPSPWKEASLRCSGRCKARWDTPFTLDRSSSRLKCHCYARSPTTTNTNTTNLLSSWSVKSRLIWECFGGWISIDLVLRKIEGNILRKIENIFRCMHRTKSPLLPFSQAAIKALAGAAVSGSH